MSVGHADVVIRGFVVMGKDAKGKEHQLSREYTAEAAAEQFKIMVPPGAYSDVWVRKVYCVEGKKRGKGGKRG